MGRMVPSWALKTAVYIKMTEPKAEALIQTSIPTVTWHQMKGTEASLPGLPEDPFPQQYLPVSSFFKSTTALVQASRAQATASMFLEVF